MYCGNQPRKIADMVDSWFKNESKLEVMSVLAKSQSRPGATQAIAKDLGKIALRAENILPILDH